MATNLVKEPLLKGGFNKPAAIAEKYGFFSFFLFSNLNEVTRGRDIAKADETLCWLLWKLYSNKNSST